jgi:hypothetical protein
MRLLHLIAKLTVGSLAIPFHCARAPATLVPTSDQPWRRRCTIRKLSILFLLTGTMPPIFAAKHVTVEKLEQELANAHGQPDAKAAEQLFDLELTERVSSATLARWEAELPGPKCWLSWPMLRHLSVFRQRKFPPPQRLTAPRKIPCWSSPRTTSRTRFPSCQTSLRRAIRPSFPMNRKKSTR